MSHDCHPERSADAFCRRGVEGSLFDFNRSKNAFVSAMPFADAKQRFSDRVADYSRYRPSYPSGIVQLLREECGLRPEHVIADIGSGTGLLSKLFLDHGNGVFCVEPNPEMRAAGEAFLQQYANFHSVSGSAEATTLAAHSVEFITAGQAFHWFQPAATRAEFQRILKPGGWVVIAWNDRRMDESPFAREYEALLQRFGTDYKTVRDAYPEAQTIREFLNDRGLGKRDLPNHQIFDWEGLCGRLQSCSYAPKEDHPIFAPMMAELQRLFSANQRDGRVRMDYFTRVYFGQFDRN
ncbi:MAG TPA: class I SAM-dependent methyltransferase [Candidatus Acidoferrum sp.]|nr:class I SAM-dependent methyltransferase [Candidatus Acidoferrum sp.]